jgi:hypothetical protein
MAKPELRQFGELEVEDFERHPVWIGCHTADYGKPWYGQTDEETFRPWTGKFPADPEEGMFLVRAVIVLRDGSRYPGFVTPVKAANNQADGRANYLGAQQPQIFVDRQRFSLWGGMIGIPASTQQELYAALGKKPDAIFPLHFSADLRLTSGLATGQVDGFYRRSREGIQVTIAQPADEHEAAGTTGFFRMSAKSWQGYPMPGGLAKPHAYKSAVYAAICSRCGMYDGQTAPFRFAKSGRRELSGFMQFNGVADQFFVRPDIAQEIAKAGITGVSFGPALDHRSGVELADRVQLHFANIEPCAETSQLPTVTCRPENEEVIAIRAIFAKQKPLPEKQGESLLSRELKEKLRKDGEKIAAFPYCGRVKHHVPTSLALIPGKLKSAPDLFQTAEWFGSGAVAFRLTIVSERFVNLVRERGWKGLAFQRAAQRGCSEREM